MSHPNEDKRASSRGAVQAKTRLTDRFRGWRRHHASSARESLARLLKTPFQTLMTSLVVAIALALPSTLFVALNNVQQLGESWDASPKISIFIHVRSKPSAIEQLQSRLKAMPEVKDLAYISPEQALREFQQSSGFGEVLNILDQNPLPPTIVITPAPSAVDPIQLQLLTAKIAQEPIVDEVDMDMDWVRRLRQMMVLGKKIVLALAGLLGLGVLLALGNTIRLAIENRRDEIIITKLVGGTNGFVRRPFLYCGAWYGFMGGVLACVLVGVGEAYIGDAVSGLAAAYQSDFVLRGLAMEGNLFLLCFSALLGLIGAWLAVGRHLSAIEPS